MCGICGAVGIPVDDGMLRSATDLMRHRGPDETGYYRDNSVALGMRRLSIIDLRGGSQPKTNESGSLHVVFNGEIYNYRELRDELRRMGHTFGSDSDTEVIVHAYEQWGHDCFARLNGIFAVALWDSVERRLVLTRDHLGVKPLYYTARSGYLVFGSELKPLLRLLPDTPSIDPEAALLFLRYQYVPSPRSIFAGVHKLPAGHVLVVPTDGAEPSLHRYWSPPGRSVGHQGQLSRREAEDLVDQAIGAAVKRQMVSDVPLGAFLSGGVDSSTVVAAMQRASAEQVKTFCIGFHEAEEDESQFAAQVAAHLGTDHHSWIITEEDALTVVPRLPYYFDEPFADASAVPTYLVSELARRHVTVALSGDDGDELFGGYRRYAQTALLGPWWAVPQPLRKVGVDAASALPGRLGRNFRRASGVLRAESVSEAYRNMVAVTPDARLAAIGRNAEAAWHANAEWPGETFSGRSVHEAMMLTDLVTYLPDDILTKVDRASMAHSLEARVPLLDVELVELAIGLPVSSRLAGGPKGLLKSVLKRHIPAELVDRPKHGFGIPIHDWLRGKLRDSVTDFLSPEALQRHDLFDAGAVQRIIWEHVEGGQNRGYTLWALLTFQMWYEHFYRAQSWRSESFGSRTPAAG